MIELHPDLNRGASGQADILGMVIEFQKRILNIFCNPQNEASMSETNFRKIFFNLEMLMFPVI
jgi:hypothetical protein